MSALTDRPVTAPRSADRIQAAAGAMNPSRVCCQARIRHQLPAVDADSLALRGRAPSSRFDVLSSTPASSSGPRDQAGRRLDALTTKVGDGCGLADRFAPARTQAPGCTAEFHRRIRSPGPVTGACAGFHSGHDRTVNRRKRCRIVGKSFLGTNSLPSSEFAYGAEEPAPQTSCGASPPVDNGGSVAGAFPARYVVPP